MRKRGQRQVAKLGGDWAQREGPGLVWVGGLPQGWEEPVIRGCESLGAWPRFEMVDPRLMGQAW